MKGNVVATTRFESSVTSVSWIPSEAIEGLSKFPFDLGITHYDDPPPDTIEDLDALRRPVQELLLALHALGREAPVGFRDNLRRWAGQGADGFVLAGSVTPGPRRSAPAGRISDS